MRTWSETFRQLSDKQAGVLAKALAHFDATGETPVSLKDGLVKVIFSMIVSGSIHTNEQTCQFGVGGESACFSNNDPVNEPPVELFKKKRGCPKGVRNNPNGRKGSQRTNSELIQELNKTNSRTNSELNKTNSRTNSELNKTNSRTNSELVNFENAPHVNNINIINKHAHEHESEIHANETKKTNSELVNGFFDIPQEAFSETEELIANWSCFMAKWQELCESKTIKAEMPKWIEVPNWCYSEFRLRMREYGLDGLLRAVDELREKPFFKTRKIGLKTFLHEKTIPTMESGGYDWNPDEPKGKQKPDKRKGTAGAHPDDVEKYKSFDLTMKFDP